MDVKPSNWIRLGTGRTGVNSLSKTALSANTMDHDDMRGCCSMPADPWSDEAALLGRRSTTSLQFPSAVLDPSFNGGQQRERYPSRTGADDSISTQVNFPGCDQGSTTHDFHGHVQLHQSQPLNTRCRSPNLEEIFFNAFDNPMREAPQPRQSEHGCSQSLCAVTSRDQSDSLASADEGKPKSGASTGKRKRYDEITDDLTPEEARRRRRMLSNRESARRSRLRKQGQLQEMEESMKKLQQVNETLTQMLNEQRVEHESLTEKVHSLHNDNENLRKQVTMLAKFANVTVNLPPAPSPTR